MLNGPLFRQQSFRLVGHTLLKIVLASAWIFLALTCQAQQTTPHQTAHRKIAPYNDRPASKASSGFLEAKELLGQGRLDEAKQKIQEQLKDDPTSVEGYNLLGIIYSDQKDYSNALEAFQLSATDEVVGVPETVSREGIQECAGSRAHGPRLQLQLWLVLAVEGIAIACTCASSAGSSGNG